MWHILWSLYFVHGCLTLWHWSCSFPCRIVSCTYHFSIVHNPKGEGRPVIFSICCTTFDFLLLYIGFIIPLYRILSSHYIGYIISQNQIYDSTISIWLEKFVLFCSVVHFCYWQMLIQTRKTNVYVARAQSNDFTILNRKYEQCPWLYTLSVELLLVQSKLIMSK